MKATLGLVGLAAVIALMLSLLHHELHGIHYHQILLAVSAESFGQILWAVGLAVCRYGALSFYDYLGLRYAEHPLSYRETVPASFISYALSNNVGLGMLGGMAFRYRLYSGFGLSTLEITKVVFFCGSEGGGRERIPRCDQCA